MTKTMTQTKQIRQIRLIHRKPSPAIPISKENPLWRLPDGRRLAWVPNWDAAHEGRFDHCLQYCPAQAAKRTEALTFWHVYKDKRTGRLMRRELTPCVHWTFTHRSCCKPRRILMFKHNGKQIYVPCAEVTVVALTGYAIPDRRHNVVDHKEMKPFTTLDDRPVNLHCITQRENTRRSREHRENNRLSNEERKRQFEAKRQKMLMHIYAAINRCGGDPNDAAIELAMMTYEDVNGEFEAKIMNLEPLRPCA